MKKVCRERNDAKTSLFILKTFKHYTSDTHEIFGLGNQSLS